MASVKLTVVRNTENKIKLVLSENNVVKNHTTITSAELRTALGITLASSLVDSTDWDFTNAGYLTVKLGQASLPIGQHTCRLVIRDATYTVGLVWDTEIILTVLP